MINGILPFQMGGQHFRCEMQYEETAPYELTFVFRQACMDTDCQEIHEEKWIIGRDLLVEGLNSELWVGEGDVKLRRDSHNSVEIRLSSHEGSNTLTVPRRPLKSFIAWTENLVARGRESEQYDWDALDQERVTW